MHLFDTIAKFQGVFPGRQEIHWAHDSDVHIEQYYDTKEEAKVAKMELAKSPCPTERAGMFATWIFKYSKGLKYGIWLHSEDGCEHVETEER